MGNTENQFNYKALTIIALFLMMTLSCEFSGYPPDLIYSGNCRCLSFDSSNFKVQEAHIYRLINGSRDYNQIEDVQFEQNIISLSEINLSDTLNWSLELVLSSKRDSSKSVRYYADPHVLFSGNATVRIKHHR